MKEYKECPMYKFCKTIGNIWGSIIVESLSGDPEVGFNELLRKMKLNPEVLERRL